MSNNSDGDVVIPIYESQVSGGSSSASVASSKRASSKAKQSSASSSSSSSTNSSSSGSKSTMPSRRINAGQPSSSAPSTLLSRRDKLIEEDEKTSPRRKPNHGSGCCSGCSRCSGSFTVVLTWVNFVILILVIVFCAILWATQPAPTTTSARSDPGRQITPISIRSDEQSTIIPFTLIPDKDSNGKYMTLPINVNVKELHHFEICCLVQEFFFCGMSMKNLGVSGYLTSTNTAVVQIVHDDMIKAQCKLVFY